jgi:hypothetical protein
MNAHCQLITDNKELLPPAEVIPLTHSGSLRLIQAWPTLQAPGSFTFLAYVILTEYKHITLGEIAATLLRRLPGIQPWSKHKERTYEQD